MSDREPTQDELLAMAYADGELTDEARQAALAKAIGVTRQTVIAIEQGKYSPSLESAFRIAQVFGVGLEEVFGWEPDEES